MSDELMGLLNAGSRIYRQVAEAASGGAAYGRIERMTVDELRLALFQAVALERQGQSWLNRGWGRRRELHVETAEGARVIPLFPVRGGDA